MAEKWSDDLPEDAFSSEAERTYMSALAKMREGLAKGFDFKSASTSIMISDESLRHAVLDDVLKVIIAEEHFMKGIPVEQVGQKLNLPLEQLEKAMTEMLEDVEETTIKTLYNNTEKGTEH